MDGWGREVRGLGAMGRGEQGRMVWMVDYVVEGGLTMALSRGMLEKGSWGLRRKI